MLRQLKRRDNAVIQANRVCVYAFNPFGGDCENSAQTLMQKAQLPFTPVEVSEAGVTGAIEAQKKDRRRVLWLGQGPGEHMSVENTARNDFEGHAIESTGPGSVTNPVRVCVNGLSQSNDAGNYYCNKALWTMIRNGVDGVFVHVPKKWNPLHVYVLHELMMEIS